MGQQINARDWIFQASEDPSAGSPVWATIAGLKSFSLNPGDNEESVDTTTFASAGHSESQAMQRGASLQLEGVIVRTGSTPDAGQAACDALAEEVGEASLGGVRFRHVDDTDWVVWAQAWVSKGENAGGNNDKTSWSAKFMRSGAATTAAVS
jgi:hypothetical protein